MVHVIPQYVQTPSPAGMRLCRAMAVESHGRVRFIDIVWEVIGVLSGDILVYSLQNADELRAAGVKFIINDSLEPEAWDASKDFERWG